MLCIRTLFIAAFLLAAAIPIEAQNQDRFRVAIVNSQGREAPLHMATPPAFVVDFGPQTKTGRPEEFAAYKQSLASLPVSPVPGSELFASPWAKEGFTHTFQRLYRSFDMGDYHFVILDSTTRSQLGHCDNALLKWLEDDLKKMKKTASAVVFTHHPIG